MLKRDIYLGQESLETVEEWIRVQLKNGSKKEVVANSMLGKERGNIIVSKWDGSTVNSLSHDEQLTIIKEFIDEKFKYHIERSCVSDEIKELMKDNYVGMDIDAYGDCLTDLMNSAGYQTVNHHITNILACFKPYLEKAHPRRYEQLSKIELEIELVKFVKEHLKECFENSRRGEIYE